MLFRSMENGQDKNIAAIVACSIVVVSGMLLGGYYIYKIRENLKGKVSYIYLLINLNIYILE